MNVTIQFPDPMIDPMDMELPALPARGDQFATPSKTYTVHQVVHCPDYPPDHAQVRVVLRDEGTET